MENKSRKSKSANGDSGNIVVRLLKRYFVTGLGAMAMGLFSSLVIGLIISQLAKIQPLSWLGTLTELLEPSSPVIGCAVGAAVAWGLKAAPLALFSSAVTGAIGYAAGGPVACFVAAAAGAEIGTLVSGKTRVDIVLVPIATIIIGGLAGQFVGKPVSAFMTMLGDFINNMTSLNPIPMGIVVAVVVGMALTGPISSAALAISLGLSGEAAGAATVGCCAQMIGFAVISYKDNGIGGLIAQGLGTSKLQISNVVKKPAIWIPPTLTAALLGPVAVTVFGMQNQPTGAGMGTSGLVGQFGTWAAMSGTDAPWLLISKIALMHFIFPALLSLAFSFTLKKWGWIKPGDMKLEL